MKHLLVGGQLWTMQSGGNDKSSITPDWMCMTVLPVSNTMTNVTRPACGIPAAPILAAVAVMLKKRCRWRMLIVLQRYSIRPSRKTNSQTHLTANNLPNDSGMPRNCAMKMAATASYKAVPSILIVAPIGNINREICESTLLFSSKHLMVTGNVAELKRNRRTQKPLIFSLVKHTSFASMLI